jgi:SAM-dependent methyltransferase
MSYLQDLQSSWNEFGLTDPLWAIVTHPEKKGNKWELNEFFDLGIREIGALMDHLESRHISTPKRRALDFGCGVGRLTQALARHFNVVDGVDIAPSMIELANKFNRYGDRCRYYVTDADLSLFEDGIFDFIYTSFVLQHIKPEYSKNYIKEFLRLLAPEGVLVFLLANEPNTRWEGLLTAAHLGTKPLVYLYGRMYRTVRPGPTMELHIIRRRTIEAFLQDNGAKAIDIAEIIKKKHFHIVQYCVAKPQHQRNH